MGSLSLLPALALAKASGLKLHRTSLTIENGTNVRVKTDMVFIVEAGNTQSGTYKKIWHRGDVMPVSDVAVRHSMYSEPSAWPTGGESWFTQTMDSKGVVTIKIGIEAVQGPRNHTITLEFTVRDGVCIDNSGNPGKSADKAWLWTKWISWWKIPVQASELRIAFDDTQPEDLCALDLAGNCQASVVGPYTSSMYPSRGGLIPIQGYTWKKRGTERACPAAHESASLAADRGSLSVACLFLLTLGRLRSDR